MATQPSQSADSERPLNFQIPPKGFDSYLEGILPDDQAVLAGAFATAMGQIKNIEKVKLKDFAQVAYNNETTFGLPAVNGSDVPVDLQLAQVAQTLTALGSGVYGTYTMSNFFGCMSGLPYPLRDIYNGIKELETEKLKKIYQQIYLAVKSQQATFTVNITATPTVTGPVGGVYTYSYTITNIAPWTGEAGGGYGRAEATAPIGYLQDGSTATVSTTIDTNPNNVPGTYGKVISATMTSLGITVSAGTGSSPTYTPPSTATVICQSPPDGIYAYPYTGGTNGTNINPINWTTLNTAIDIPNMIKEANDEIEAIENASPANFKKAQILDTNWNITGIALKHEQRARFIAIPPVPSPDYDRWLTNYPVALYTFTDSVPQLAQNTLPHMSSQTLEHISDLDLVGGQSTIALMRQERNAARMSLIGTTQDNNLADALPPVMETQLMVDGVLPGAVEGINGYTLPAWPEDSEPLTVYDPDLPGLRYIEELGNGDVEPLIEIDFTDIPLPEDPPVVVDTVDGPILRPATAPTPIVNPKVPLVLGAPVQEPDYPLQPTISTLPPRLQTNNTGTTLYPATYDVPTAIDKVVECNCDCWVY